MTIHRKKDAAVRLFCLPYAGGSARVFETWHTDLPDDVEVVPVELPGRGMRFDQPPCDTLESLLEDLRERIEPKLDRPYAVFGHSLGAMLGYKLVCEFQQKAKPARHFFVSGAGAPHISSRNPAYYLADDALREHLTRLGGTPREVIENDEVMALVLPTVRADFTIADTYVERGGAPLTCPVTAFCGDSDDEAPPADVRAWRRYVHAPFAVHLLNGGHFFLDTERKTLLGLIGSALRAVPAEPLDALARRGEGTA